MNFIYNQMNRNFINSNISNSIIFYLFFKKNKQRNFLKSYNEIKGCYDDTVVKKKIFISSNGLKKNAVFTKHYLNEHILEPQSNNFVCYFWLLEGNLFRFTFLPKYYIKALRKKHLYTQTLINILKKKKHNILISKLRNKFFSNNLSANLWKNNQKLIKVVVIKNWYRRLIILTSTGLFKKKTRRKYKLKTFVLRLNIFFKWYMKIWLRRIWKITYMLLRFFSGTALTWKKSSHLVASIVVYFFFFRFLHHRFKKNWKRRRFHFRKRNKFLKVFFLIKNPEIKKWLKFYYFISFKKSLFNFHNLVWFKNFFFNEVADFFNNNSYELINSDFLNKINLIDFDKRFEIINYVNSLLFINFLQKFNIIRLVSKLLDHFYYFKAILLKYYFIEIFKERRLSKKFTFYISNYIKPKIYDFFILKTLVKNKIKISLIKDDIDLLKSYINIFFIRYLIFKTKIKKLNVVWIKNMKHRKIIFSIYNIYNTKNIIDTKNIKNSKNIEKIEENKSSTGIVDYQNIGNIQNFQKLRNKKKLII